MMNSPSHSPPPPPPPPPPPLPPSTPSREHVSHRPSQAVDVISSSQLIEAIQVEDISAVEVDRL